MDTKRVLPVVFVLAGAAPARADDGLADLSIEELLEVPVTTPSRAEEALADAPATVVVITRDEIEARGYRELSQVLDDLPGLDVVRPYGDSWVLSYWRGYRTDQTSPFLLMLDAMIVNSIYTSDTEGNIAAIPLSSVERIEVVYGPASSTYGPNAFMGVINVITRNDLDEDGVSQRARLGVGTSEERLVDLQILARRGKARFSLSARLGDGELDDSNHDAYEYAKDRYYADRRLWGGFVDNPAIAGRFRSTHQDLAVDGRLHFGRSELGVRYLRFTSGYGYLYAADKVQNDAHWTRRELGFHIRHAQELTTWLDTTTLVRYRESGIPGDSSYVDGYEEGGRRLAAYSYWQTRNRSWTILEDLTATPLPRLTVTFGFRFEFKDLQKAYDVAGEGPPGTPGGYTPVEDIDAETYPYPEPPVAIDAPQNRITTEDVGAYLQTRLELTPRQRVFAGVRADRNSGYETAPTLRVGWVGRFGRVGVKALYGQAFKEPSPRLLYGGWTGSGADPRLVPERSQTFEASVNHTWPALSTHAGVWHVENRSTILAGLPARNLGKRTAAGLELSFQLRLAGAHAALRRLDAWGFYDHLLRADEEAFSPSSALPAGTARIPDLADDKLHLGLTAELPAGVTVSLRGRVIGPRPTAPTNPVGEVDGFASLDAHVAWRDALGSGVGVSLAVDNLTDAVYFHPGVNEASAGVTPGRFDPDGTYHGSSGYFSSLLPQPGRSFFLSLWVER